MKTKKELLEIAERIAKDSIFEGAEDTGVMWKGLHVFMPVLKPNKDGEHPCIGLPQFILLDDEGNEKETGISYEETFEIMGLLPDEEDFEE